MRQTQRLQRRTLEPKRPSVSAQRIARESLRPNASVADIAVLVEMDGVLRHHVLTAVNCEAFALPRKVNDVPRACAMLGLRGLGSLGLSVALLDALKLSGAGPREIARSLRRAVLAQMLSAELAVGCPTTFFALGLMLELAERDLRDEVGGESLGELLLLLLHALQTSGVDHLEVERQVGLAIRARHDATPPSGELCRVAWLAERFARVWEEATLSAAYHGARTGAAAVGLPAEVLHSMLERVPDLVTGAAEAFSQRIQPQRYVRAIMLARAQRATLAFSSRPPLAGR